MLFGGSETEMLGSKPRGQIELMMAGFCGTLFRTAAWWCVWTGFSICPGCERRFETVTPRAVQAGQASIRRQH